MTPERGRGRCVRYPDPCNTVFRAEPWPSLCAERCRPSSAPVWPATYFETSALRGASFWDTAAQVTRAAAMNRRGLQVEDELNSPRWLAEEAVVVCSKVPRTVAVVPDAVFEKLNDADPAPPTTSSSSASFSSIMISI